MRFAAVFCALLAGCASVPPPEAPSPDAQLGQWKRFERNYVEDFTRAFGVGPGRLVGVGIMTDTDNTGEQIEAFYGDIELKPAR